MSTAALRIPDAAIAPRASRLQAELAARILRVLKEQGAAPGHHLVELELCRLFDVSRTPVRGALRLLAEQGLVEARANRGYVLRRPVVDLPDNDPLNPEDEEDRRLFIGIAEARYAGRIPDQCSQQEIVRILGAKLTTVVRVLRQLGDLGLVERKPGNGWSFAPSIHSSRARDDSYAFRLIVEPAGLAESSFELDRNWLERSRAEHLAFARRRWRDTMAVELFRMNADFHEALARCSGNRYILDAVQRQNRLRMFLNAQWVEGGDRVTHTIEEHLEIMDRLEAGQNLLASSVLREHLGGSRERAPTIG
ncbi:GntR family transcriptional regulator [soil metagenome]